ncbi:MAG: AbrB/MazE/SpoVT family DNA-binding domain-containing protein [Desulfovibrionaceae bacterium]|nr:AbrB/MazE/SpoVT family DNA-binding domain-containing protein [Desulfovibrionaceae bacterium]
MDVARIVKDEQGQVVMLPGQWFACDTVAVRRVGNALILSPAGAASAPWEGFFAALRECSPDFMDEREEPQAQEREGL